MKNSIVLFLIYTILLSSCTPSEEYSGSSINYEMQLTIFPPAAGADVPLLVYFPEDGKYLSAIYGLIMEEIIVDGVSLKKDQTIMYSDMTSSKSSNSPLYTARRKGLGWMTIEFAEYDPEILSSWGDPNSKDYSNAVFTVHVLNKPLRDIEEIIFKYRYRYPNNKISKLNTAKIYFDVYPTSEIVPIVDDDDEEEIELIENEEESTSSIDLPTNTAA